MISYSARAARAIGFLKKAYNDIEVYVEDSSSHTMWLRVIQALLPQSVRLKSVNPLRGRDTVVDACRRDQADDGRRRIYIIDGDFDFLLGRRRTNLRRLYRLRAYCIENLLLGRDGLIEVSIDASGQSDRGVVAQQLNLEDLITNHEQALRDLFYCYAAAYKLAPAIQTVGYSVMRLTNSISGSVSLDRTKIRNRTAEVIRAVRTAGFGPAFRRLFEQCRQRGANLLFNFVVSGKDYLLPVIWLKIRRDFTFRGSQEQFKIQLARQFDVRAEPYLARAIRRAAA